MDCLFAYHSHTACQTKKGPLVLTIADPGIACFALKLLPDEIGLGQTWIYVQVNVLVLREQTEVVLHLLV